MRFLAGRRKLLMRKTLNLLVRKFQSGTFLVSLKVVIWPHLPRKTQQCLSNIIKNQLQNTTVNYFFVSTVVGLHLLFLSYIWSDIWSDIFLTFFFFVVGDHSPTEIYSGIFQEVRNANKISMTKNILGDNRIETTVTAEKLASREIPLTSGRNSGTLNNTLQLFVR